MRHGIRVGRLFGVDVTIDWSWFVIAALAFSHLGWTLWQWHHEWGLATCIATAATGTAALFASILAHELGHALVAQASGMRPRSIRFFLFGAATQLERDRATPLREALTAAVGPAISLAIGAALLVLCAASALYLGHHAPDPMKLVVLAGPWWTLAMWTGSINVLLGFFNLVPAFPLDGGRLLRSALWGLTGDVKRATRYAAIVSQLIAGAFIAVGLFVAFSPAFGLSLGDHVLSALWLAFIGWFLLGAASHSYRHVLMEEALEGVPVRRLMRPHVPLIEASARVSELIERWMDDDHDRFVVVDGERVQGVVDVRNAKSLPRERWDATAIRQLARPLATDEQVSPEMDGAEAFHRLSASGRNELIVLDARTGAPAGVLRWRDVLRWLELQSDEPGLWHPAAGA